MSVLKQLFTIFEVCCSIASLMNVFKLCSDHFPSGQEEPKKYALMEQDHPLSTLHEKTLVAQIKSNLLLNIQMYNMSSLQIIQFKTD